MSYGFEFQNEVQAQEIAAIRADRGRPSNINSIPLLVTTEPVWPEDEIAVAQRRGDDVERQFATDNEIMDVLPGIHVVLPERLYMSGPTAESKKTRRQSGKDFSKFRVQIPTSFYTPDDWNVKRLRLEILLEPYEGRLEAVVVDMEPRSKIETTSEKLGAVGIDLAKGLGAFSLAPLGVSGKLEKPLAFNRMERRIRAIGLQTHACSWHVADDVIVYEFSPFLEIEHRIGTGLTVSVLLRVDIERKVLRLFHKIYFKSAEPKSYIYKPGATVLWEKQVERNTEVDADDSKYAEIFDRYKGKPLNYEPRLCELAHTGHPRYMEQYGDLKRDQGNSDLAGVWYRKASEAGNAKAMVKLAAVLLGKRQLPDAKHWYERAGASGNPAGWRELGKLLEKTDRRSAREYYRRAAQTGDEASVQRLRRLYVIWWLHPSLWAKGGP